MCSQGIIEYLISRILKRNKGDSYSDLYKVKKCDEPSLLNAFHLLERELDQKLEELNQFRP